MKIFECSVKDAFSRGLIGGAVAGTVKDIPDIFLRIVFKVKKLGFWDYIGEMIFNQIPRTWVDYLLTFVLEVVFSLGLGVVYCTIVVPKFPTKMKLTRGLLYGAACWFVLTSVVKLFHIEKLITKDSLTPIVTMVLSALYGLLLEYINEKLRSRLTKELN